MILHYPKTTGQRLGSEKLTESLGGGQLGLAMLPRKAEDGNAGMARRRVTADIAEAEIE